ncbi:MAG TPA: NUDIX hydrolase [Niabella sp.]|nr:NUDIX hydrolase [Niabella sp.]HOZ96459.1 NUDIX hydrolase [Niabella sp.]HQW13360.1 NUDIX hydrolase [Niabella sp.]HQX18600.1 NUDIX hydrolase [Niabella sp.]HRB06497.1 NUDIX hydrolase [Niabella sp.]
MRKNDLVSKYHVAIDCIVFGFDDGHLKILLIKRSLEPEKGKWSLMGGFVTAQESADEAANRILQNLTGLSGIYLEQLHTFSEPNRDPIGRTISISYFALIDINNYKESINDGYEAAWFPIKDFPALIFDHNNMVLLAQKRLQYKAASHTILFELLPEKFTLPLLQSLFEDVFNTVLDKGNFSRKMLSTNLLIKQKEKDKSNSKKGAYYYKLDKKHYLQNLHKIQKLIPNPNSLL